VWGRRRPAQQQAGSEAIGSSARAGPQPGNRQVQQRHGPRGQNTAIKRAAGAQRRRPAAGAATAAAAAMWQPSARASLPAPHAQRPRTFPREHTSQGPAESTLLPPPRDRQVLREAPPPKKARRQALGPPHAARRRSARWAGVAPGAGPRRAEPTAQRRGPGPREGADNEGSRTSKRADGRGKPARAGAGARAMAVSCFRSSHQPDPPPQGLHGPKPRTNQCVGP
jgi:hypothetical protein